MAAVLLKQEGYDVTGITLRLYNQVDSKNAKSCCAGKDIEDAKKVAKQFNFPHLVMNYQDKFFSGVIDNFVESYAFGETPIPCVRCNQTVKFTDLLKEAKNKKLVPTRINLTRVSKEFTDKFGKDYWSKRAIKKIKSFKGSKFVITGIRRLEDYERISSNFKNFEFYLIDAKPKLRFKRMRKRARPGDPKTYLQFLK